MLEFITENLVWVVIVGIVIIMTFIGYLAEKTDFGRKSIEKRELRAKRKVEEREKEKQEKIEKEIQKEKELAEKRVNQVGKVEEEPKKKKDKKKGKKEETVETPVEPVLPENPIPMPLEPETMPSVELATVGQETIEDLSVPLGHPVVPTIPAIEDTSIPVEVFDPIASDIPVLPEASIPVPLEPEVNPSIEPNPIAIAPQPIAPSTPVTVEPVEVMEINPAIESEAIPQDISTIMPGNTPLPDITTLQNTVTNDEEVLEEDDVWKF